MVWYAALNSLETVRYMAATLDIHSLSASSLQIKDVYNVAQRVGEEFQSFIQNFGSTHTAAIVELVISVLELLESSVDLSHNLQMKQCSMLLDRDNLMRDKEEREVNNTQ